MTETPLSILGPCETWADQVEQIAAELGLIVTMRSTLRKCPGSQHWHLKKEKLPGVLEVTIWPAEARAWLSNQSGRQGDWIADAVVEFTSRAKG